MEATYGLSILRRRDGERRPAEPLWDLLAAEAPESRTSGLVQRCGGLEQTGYPADHAALYPRLPLYQVPEDYSRLLMVQVSAIARAAAAERDAVPCDVPPCRWLYPPRDGSIDLAEDYSVPEGRAESALAPVRRLPSARRATAPERVQTFFLFHRARRIFFLMPQKENGGRICQPSPWLPFPAQMGGLTTAFPHFQKKEGTQSWTRF